MNKYILINHIQVQNANAIAGFTWGFPAITHFLGFSHNLSRKLSKQEDFNDIKLSGCAVISHTHQVHTYGDYEQQFTQTRNSPYLSSHKKDATPPIIEEGKMNMTVSLLIKYDGDIGNRNDDFVEWLENICYLQRLAGGTILDIKAIQLFTVNNENIHTLKRLLLPGFVLMDKSDYLQEHYQTLQKENQNKELFNAWLDFLALKQGARPKYDLIAKHFTKLSKDSEDNVIIQIWRKHLEQKPYVKENIPQQLKEYFSNNENSFDKKLLIQWQEYCQPNEKTDANWEYLPKPKPGYLVPIMTGYKAISKVYKNDEVENTRDNETDICFVESVHSIGEWLSAHRLTVDLLKNSLWHYDYEENWYLCSQSKQILENEDEISFEDSDDGMN